MSDYRRLISYIYAYDKDMKGHSVGFAKLESRNGQCKISVSVKKLYAGSTELSVYLLTGEQEIYVGRFYVRGQSGEFRTAVQAENVEKSGISLSAMHGLSIRGNSGGRYYMTIWEEPNVHAAELEVEGELQAAGDGILTDSPADSGLLPEEADPTLTAALKGITIPLTASRPKEQDLRDCVRYGEQSQGHYAGQYTEQIPDWYSGQYPLQDQQETVSETESDAGAVIEDGREQTADIEILTDPEAEAVPETVLDMEAPVDSSFTEENEPLAADLAAGQEPGAAPLNHTLPEWEPPHAEGSIADTEPAADAVAEDQGVSSPESAMGERRPEEADWQVYAQAAARGPLPLWEKLRKRYAKIQAFDHAGGCEILTIKPQDIGLLPSENWVYGNNSFLLHGYYNYRYLVLVKLNDQDGSSRYLLGVPGMYYTNEKYMASMFGFSEFVLAKKQPHKDGRFGYWYTDISLG